MTRLADIIMTQQATGMTLSQLGHACLAMPPQVHTTSMIAFRGFEARTVSWTRPTGKMPQHQRLQLIMHREPDSAAAKRRRPHPVRVVETSPLPLHSPSLRPPPVVGASNTKTRIASEDRPVPRTCQSQRERPVPPALLTPALQAGGCSLRNGVADQLVNATITA